MEPSREDEYEMPDEIDFSQGTWMKNPFIQEFKDLNLVFLDAELRAAFPDSQSVDDALRLLLQVGREMAKRDLPKAS